MQKKEFVEKKDHSYTVTWIENDILYMVYKPDLIVTLDVAKTIVSERLEHYSDNTRPMFIDIRNLVAVDAKARDYFTSEEATRYISAGAVFLEHSLTNIITSIAGNVFLKVDKPPIPTQIFTNSDTALQWLESYKYQER